MGENITARMAAEQTANDTTDEFGAPAEVDGTRAIIDNSENDVSARVLYGYADTTAASNNLTVELEQLSENQIAVNYSETQQ